MTIPALTDSTTSQQKANIATLLHKAVVYLFHLLVIILPLLFSPINHELFEFSKMLLVYLATILIASVWILRMILTGKIIFHRSKLDWAMWLFFASQIISTLTSMHVQTSLSGYYTRFHGGLYSTISYLILYHALTTHFNLAQLKKLWLSFSLSALLVALYALPEHFGHSFSCITIANQFNNSCWVQDVQHRIFGTFGQPNWLAAYIVTLLPVMLAFVLTKPAFFQDLKTYLKSGYRLIEPFLITTVFLLFLTLIFTQSRSGILALAGGLGLFVSGVVLLVLRSRSPQTSIIWHKGGLIGGGFLLSCIIFGTVFTPSLGKFFQDSPLATTSPATPVVDRLEQGGTDSGEIRKIVWQGAIDVWRRYPLFGSGVETFAYSYYQDRPVAHNLVSEWDFLYNKAHNEFLNFLATTGLLGFISYVAIIFFFSLKVIRYLFQSQTQGQGQQKLFALGLMSGYAGLAISNFFGFSTVTVGLLFFLYPGMMVILDEKNTSSLKPSPPAKMSINLEELSFQKVGSASFLVLICLFLVLTVGKIWLADYYYAQGVYKYKSGYLSESAVTLKKAIDLTKNQALYHNHISQVYVQIAIALAQQGDFDQAEIAAGSAILALNKTLELNPVHLNFYKNQISNMINLAALNQEFLQEAKRLSEIAIKLAPTDAKLFYYLALIDADLGDFDQAQADFAQAIELKPNYLRAREVLAQELAKRNQFQAALDQYDYILDNLDPDNQIMKDRVAQIEASASAEADNQ